MSVSSDIETEYFDSASVIHLNWNDEIAIVGVRDLSHKDERRRYLFPTQRSILRTVVILLHVVKYYILGMMEGEYDCS